MKMSFFYLILLVSNVTLAQNSDKECRKCNTSKVSIDYLNPYFGGDTVKQRIIERNWNEFLGEDLEESLPSRTSNAKVITLKFDGLGSIYPIFVDSSYKKVFDFYKKTSPTYLITNTFFGLKYGPNYKNEMSNLDYFYSLAPKNESNRLKSIYDKNSRGIDEDFFNFTEEWNSEYMPNQIEKIKSVISENSINKIVLICHGYNLPYSLAQIQANNIIDIYASQGKTEIDKILFLKVFYPSSDNKTSYFEDQNMSFVNDLKIKTIPYFSYVTNRAFNVGLSLRKVLNSFEYDGKIEIVAHSLGCVTVSAMLINPKQKINLDKNDSDYNKLMVSKFESEDPPNKNISLFLNAAAMPGVGTFNEYDLKHPNQGKYTWVIGSNKNDKVLKKKLFVFRFPESNGNTRLGANDRGEVEKTIEELKSIELVKGKFNFVETGVQKDLFGHDFFCYLQQPYFQKEFKLFINR